LSIGRNVGLFRRLKENLVEEFFRRAGQAITREIVVSPRSNNGTLEDFNAKIE